MDRCALCPGVHACIPPDGPEDADILFIGEAPGKDEERLARLHPPGRPFVGRTGEEVDGHYLPLAGLRRPTVRMVNTIRCAPPTPGHKLDLGKAAHRDLADCCAAHFLFPLLERTRPRLVVPLGAFAVRTLCPDLDLETGHGLPVDTAFGPAYPMYHPALGMHEPKKMLYIRQDWHRLRRYLSGSWTRPVDDYPEPDYAEVTDADEIRTLDPSRNVGLDTEARRDGTPFCLTYSQFAGSGRLIRADRPDLLGTLADTLAHHHRGTLLFHNWLYDAAIVRAMGLALPSGRLVDTMADTFRLGHLPQGLKALAFREVGMTMQDFDDVVRPHSRRRVLDYYIAAAYLDYPKPPEELTTGADGLLKLYRPQSQTTKFKRFFTDLAKYGDGKDVFGVWEGWDQSAIETAMGEPWPGICISHVPFADALYYACRDADALVRLYPLLRRMRQRVRRFSAELW